MCLGKLGNNKKSLELVMKRIKKSYRLEQSNQDKITELSKILNISQNKVINLMIEMLNPTYLIIYKKEKKQ